MPRTKFVDWPRFEDYKEIFEEYFILCISSTKLPLLLMATHSFDLFVRPWHLCLEAHAR